jgi:hypothetical protein
MKSEQFKIIEFCNIGLEFFWENFQFEKKEVKLL